jgi:hypothetical protein
MDRKEFCKATVIDRYFFMQLSAVTSHDTLSTEIRLYLELG